MVTRCCGTLWPRSKLTARRWWNAAGTERSRAILLGASNSWFPVTYSVLSIPGASDKIGQLVAQHWALLEKATSKQNVELLRRLAFGGVRVSQLTSQVTIGADAFPAGTWIVPTDQEFGAMAREVLDVQRYPDLRQYPGGPPERPYDAAGWSLPLQMGVHVIAVTSPLGDNIRGAAKLLGVVVFACFGVLFIALALTGNADTAPGFQKAMGAWMRQVAAAVDGVPNAVSLPVLAAVAASFAYAVFRRGGTGSER